MKVLFLYTSKGAADKPASTNDWLFKPTGDYYDHFAQDGYFYFLQKMVDSKVITDLTCLVESNHNPGVANFVSGARCHVIPKFSEDILDTFVDDDTVIFVRGGFKSWHDLLLRYKNKNWLILYAANTGRDRWTWWDLIFDDLEMKNYIDGHGRYWFPFIKPINEDIFKVIDTGGEPKWDICLGASAVHDKKGQWLGVKLIKRYSELYGRDLKVIMPGGIRRGVKTNEMMASVHFMKNVLSVGDIPRPKLAEVMNNCKVFLHLGAGGQNDRGIIEARACGLHVGLSNVERFSPLFIHNHFSVSVFNKVESTEDWAEQLHNILRNQFISHGSSFEHRTRLSRGFARSMSLKNVILPIMAELFSRLGKFKPNLESKMMIKHDLKHLL